MGTKKVLDKKFTSFEQEEAWLNKLASHGWLLTHYSDEEFGATTYMFEQRDEAKRGYYKLDFVAFRNRADFDDYKELMEETGWQMLAKNEHYNKLILFSTENNKLFSDRQSQLLREARKRQAAIKLTLLSIVLGSIGALIYWQYDFGLVMVISLICFVNSLFYLANACKLTYRLRKEQIS